MRSLSEPIARMANKQDQCTGRFWEGRFKAQRIVDEAGLLACAMYVDLNPVRAAMTETPDQSPHTSAYDRIEADKGQRIHSAAFDLRPVPREQAAEEIRNTPVDELGEKRGKQRRNPTVRKIRRDDWLSPLTLSKEDLSSDPQVHRGGVRSSDRGFLHIGSKEYFELLRWTAKQQSKTLQGIGAKAPSSLAPTLTKLGIDASMWADSVWKWQKYFGRTSCVGSPTSMKKDAAEHDKPYHRGQAAVAGCFAGG